jgi:hypothetical protein
MIVGALVLSVTACGRWKGDGNDEVIPDPLGAAMGLKKSFGVPVALAGEQSDENLQHNRQVEEAEPEEGHHGGHEAPAHHGSEVAPKAVGGHGATGHVEEHKAEH